MGQPRKRSVWGGLAVGCAVSLAACASSHHSSNTTRAGGVEATQSEFRAALRFAKCMRTHGFADFPDPTRFDSPPGPILIIGAGLFFRVSPSFNADAPAVKQAVSACGGR
jgi:hypothetical protein